ncbi:cytochrome P450 [Streptomyces subrutilus]|uniref:cytochrome P450 n=1 Tax=Streptomyces subrutilus TaxID=36818 RepID=UPI0033E2BFE4
MTGRNGDRTGQCPISLDHDFYADPHPAYRGIKENGNKPTPIVLKTGMAYLPPGLEAWLVTAYEDVEFVLRDPRFRKSIDEAMPLFAAQSGGTAAGRGSLLYNNMANNDPPVHTRLRKPLNGIFTSRSVAGRRDGVRRAALETLAEVAGAESFDLVQDFAFPFSISVISRTLGVPDADRGTFHGWVQTITGDAQPEVLRRDAALMAEYLRGLIRDRRDSAGRDTGAGTRNGTGTDTDTGTGTGTDDVLTLLATSLPEDEAVAQAYALLAAGYETTANLIVTGFLTLAAHPAQRERLWSDPGLVPDAVEEMLRHQSPFNLSLYRYVTEAVEVNGVLIPQGAIVFLAFAAANRDARRFTEPDAFDIAQPRRDHLAFGGGIHNCIGKHLARMEAEVAFETLIERCPGLSVLTPDEEFDWKASPTFRGLRTLRVGPGPASAGWEREQ